MGKNVCFPHFFVNLFQELDTLNGTEPKRNVLSLQLKGVIFGINMGLIKKARKDCKLQCERLVLALDYLNKHGSMIIANYMKMTGIACAAATLELQKFRRNYENCIVMVINGLQRPFSDLNFYGPVSNVSVTRIIFQIFYRVDTCFSKTMSQVMM